MSASNYVVLIDGVDLASTRYIHVPRIGVNRYLPISLNFHK